MSKVVYTSLDDFKLKNKIVLSYSLLNDNLVEWVNEKSVELLRNRSDVESLAIEEMKRKGLRVEEQVYFNIEGKSYFLDAFFVKYNIAVEIDGVMHKSQQGYDRRRDEQFRRIGIKTIRIPSSVVRNGGTIDYLMKGMIDKPKKRKNKKTKNSKLLERENRFLRRFRR